MHQLYHYSIINATYFYLSVPFSDLLFKICLQKNRFWYNQFMKIRIEITDDSDEEIIIRTRELNEMVSKIEQAVKSITAGDSTLVFHKGEAKYYISPDEILFFETGDGSVCAHTANDVFETKYRLYELEEILPSRFMRVSKSTILNTSRVYSITRNLTASSVVEFADTHKKVYVSRIYYKDLMVRMEGKRC